MVQNITYSPAEGAECLWLCLMTTIFLLVSFDCFPLFCMLSLLWLNLLFDKSQAEDMGGIKDHRILLHFINTLFTAAKSWVAPVSIIRKKKKDKGDREEMFRWVGGFFRASGIWKLWVKSVFRRIGQLFTCLLLTKSKFVLDMEREKLLLILKVGSVPILSVQFHLFAQSCPTLHDSMNHSMPGFPVHHQLPESTQIHVHWVSDAIKTSHPLMFPSPPALNLSWHQGLFQRVSASHQVAKVLKFQLQNQSFQWTPKIDLL